MSELHGGVDASAEADRVASPPGPRFGVRFAKIIGYILVAGFVCLALMLRRGDIALQSANSLWTEDGSIFINQAFGLGVQSFVTSYQGYLHTFQRAFTLAAIQFPLTWLPYLLMGVWCLSFGGLAYVVAQRLTERRVGFLSVCFAIAVIALQPHSGEVFFSITNSQWVIGLTLAIYVAFPSQRPPKVAEIIALTVAVLTGPFCILLTPVLGLQALLLRDFRRRAAVYIVVLLGAMVQGSLVLTSPRATAAVPDFGDGLTSWVQAAFTFVTFGATNPFATAASIAAWLVVGCMFATKGSLTREQRGDVAFALLGAAVIFAVSLYSVSRWSSVTSITPLGGGARYYFVPYGLIFISMVLVLTRAAARVDRWRSLLHYGAKGLGYACIASVCALAFSGLQPRENLFWNSYARFAQIHPGVQIPINPQWNMLPIWQVIPNANLTKASPAGESVSTNVYAITRSGRPVAVVDFDIGMRCNSSSKLAFEIALTKEEEGFTEFTWSAPGRLATSNDKLLRYYPKGEVKLQFAIDRTLDERYFRADLGSYVELPRVVSAQLFCLN